MFKKKHYNQEVAEIITAGDCLRRKREEGNLSLKKISDELGIKNEYLDSLEKGNYKDLPPQVYVRGFIKSYAGYLGIDGGQLVKIYNREMSFLQKDGREEKENFSKSRFSDYLVVTPKLVTIAVSLFVIVMFGYYFLRQINSFNSKPYLLVESPVSDQIVKEKDITVSGKTEADAILKINGQDVSVNGDGVFSQKISLSEGRNMLVIEAWNRFNKSEKKEFNIVYEKPIAEDADIQETSGTGTDMPSAQNDNSVKTNGMESENTPANKGVSANAGTDADRKKVAAPDASKQGDVPTKSDSATKEDTTMDGAPQTETKSENFSETAQPAVIEN